jgi:hypothetical protein
VGIGIYCTGGSITNFRLWGFHTTDGSAACPSRVSWCTAGYTYNNHG